MIIVLHFGRLKISKNHYEKMVSPATEKQSRLQNSRRQRRHSKIYYGVRFAWRPMRTRRSNMQWRGTCSSPHKGTSRSCQVDLATSFGKTSLSANGQKKPRKSSKKGERWGQYLDYSAKRANDQITIRLLETAVEEEPGFIAGFADYTKARLSHLKGGVMRAPNDAFCNFWRSG